jgi:hypothetical protein
MEVPTVDEAAAAEKAPLKITVTIAPGAKKTPVEKVVTSTKGASMEKAVSVDKVVSVPPAERRLLWRRLLLAKRPPWKEGSHGEGCYCCYQWKEGSCGEG